MAFAALSWAIAIHALNMATVGSLKYRRDQMQKIAHPLDDMFLAGYPFR
jgi:hypothetical protein